MLFFQLLVFFMLSSSFLYPSLDLVLPRLDNVEHETTPPMLVLNLDAADNTYLNSEPIALEALEAALRERLVDVEDRAVFLRADEKASYGVILQLMRTATAAGALQFHFLYEEAAD
ncbi:MAG: biopolymer transporter ExbD [Verrucomicrobia bacterium]|nr:biopolymer transporter ExbD [Verrucomicrobiota bacterium]